MIHPIYWVRLYIDTQFYVRYGPHMQRLLLQPLIATIVLIVWPSYLAVAAKPIQEEIVFENGFTVILIENHGAPMIGSSVIVRVGSIHEDASNNGVSHMLEHLLFNGTATRTQEALYAEQAQFGIYNNAHTSQTYTNYIVLAERDHFQIAIDIQSDMLFNSVIPPGKFEKEKGIVLNEIAKEWATPRYWATEQFQRTFYRGTPYNLTVLGSPTSIRGMTRAQVLDYYQTYYVPNNMTAVIVGDFERDQMIALLRKYFGTQSPGLLPANQNHSLDTTVFGTQTTSQMAVPSPYLTIGFLAPAINSPDYYPMSIFTHIAQRNAKRLLDGKLTTMGKKPIENVRLDYVANRDFGILRVTAILREGEDSASTIQALRSVLPQAGMAVQSEHTIADLGTELKVQALSLLEKPHYYGMMKANAIANGGWQFARSYGDKISTATTMDIANVATRVFATPNDFASIIVPGSQTLEERVPVISNQYYVRATPTTDYSTSSLARVDAWTSKQSGASIMKETADVRWAPSATIHAAAKHQTRVRLTNGLTVLIDSNTDSAIFAVHVLAKHRAWLEPLGKEGIADLLHTILEHGTETLSPEGREQELSQIGATLKTRDSDAIPFDDYYHSKLYSYIRLTTIDEFADQAMNLLATLIAHPRLHQADFKDAQRKALARITARNSNPSKRAESLLYQALFANDARAHPIEGTKASVESITIGDLKKFHAQYFSPHNLVLSVSTGLPHETITTLVENEFRTLPTADVLTPSPTDIPLTHHGKEIRESLGASQSYIRLGTVFPIKPADQPALAVMNSFLSNQLSFELRERQGLAYFVRSNISFMGMQAMLDIDMGTTPQTLDKALNALDEALHDITSTAVHDDYIERIVNARNARYLMRRLTRINQAYHSGLDEFLRGHPGWASPSPAELKQVTAEAITSAMKTYFEHPEFVKVIIE